MGTDHAMKPSIHNLMNNGYEEFALIKKYLKFNNDNACFMNGHG